MSIIDNFEPRILWKHFDEIRKIPRCSKHEEKIRKYLLDFAKKHDLETKTDKAGNVVIKKPACDEMKNKPIVILQAHMDMVCEKNSTVEHDFSKDPIQLEVKGDILKAKGTTLGADDGIGIATALAVLEDQNLKLGPIEALFTVDEETGLTGAFALEPDMLTGKIMLNLDSEDFGVITIGCAGGGNSEIKLPVEYQQNNPELKNIQLNITGLKGGHSGVDIHEQRGNAIKILTRLIWKTSEKHEFAISKIQGGDKHNAIPREAKAIIAIKKSEEKNLIKTLNEEVEKIKKEFQPIDPDLKLEIKEAEKTNKTLQKNSQKKLINILHALPHGVDKMNYDIPNLVETSTNLAKVELNNKEATIILSSRSSIMSALQDMRDRIHAIANLTDAKITEEKPYPGWKPNVNSKLLKLSKNIFKDMFKEEPKVEAIHAGLECGIIGEKFENIDMISIGPTIKAPHSPDEKVFISTVEKFYRYLIEILKRV